MKNIILIFIFACSLIITAQAAEKSNATSEQSINESISRYPVPKIEDLPDDLKKIMLGAQKNLGFVPNVLLALAHRPAELRAFMSYYKALTHKESGLSKKEREMLIVAHSSVNGCMYCVVSHGSNLRLVSKNPRLSEQVATNYFKADITRREKAIITFALKVTNNSRAINEEDFKTLRSHGLNNEDIWDIAGITSFFNMSNRLMNFAAVKPNDEYYTKGR